MNCLAKTGHNIYHPLLTSWKLRCLFLFQCNTIQLFHHWNHKVVWLEWIDSIQVFQIDWVCTQQVTHLDCLLYQSRVLFILHHWFEISLELQNSLPRWYLVPQLMQIWVQSCIGHSRPLLGIALFHQMAQWGEHARLAARVYNPEILLGLQPLLLVSTNESDIFAWTVSRNLLFLHKLVVLLWTFLDEFACTNSAKVFDHLHLAGFKPLIQFVLDQEFLGIDCEVFTTAVQQTWPIVAQNSKICSASGFLIEHLRLR